MSDALVWLSLYALSWIGVWLYGRHVARAWAREEILKRAQIGKESK